MSALKVGAGIAAVWLWLAWVVVVLWATLRYSVRHGDAFRHGLVGGSVAAAPVFVLVLAMRSAL